MFFNRNLASYCNLWRLASLLLRRFLNGEMYFGDFSDYSLTLLLDSSLICFIFGVLHFTAGDHTLIYLTLSYYCDYLVIELNIPKGALLEVIARLLKPAVSVLALRLC